MDDVRASASISPQDAMVLEPGRLSLVQRLRCRLMDNVTRLFVRDPEIGAIIAALVVGEQGSMGPALREWFSRSGLSHLLSVSGLHLALVAGALLFMLGRLFRRWTWLARRTDPIRIAACCATAGAVGYAAITGAAPATVRACIMACTCLLGIVFSRRADLWRPLCLAALVMLLVEPAQLFRAGFQLSFVAVIGLALSVRISQTPRPRESWPRRAWSWLVASMRTSVAATAITTPLVLHHFGEATAIGPLANLVAIPLTCFFILPLGLIGSVVSLIIPDLGNGLLFLAGEGTRLLISLARQLAAMDALLIRGYPGWALTLSLTSLVLALLLRGRKRGVVLILSLAAIGLCLLVPWVRSRPDLELTFLDVGQGDSTFVRLPSGETILIDGGGSNDGAKYDPGQRVVLPFLRRAGVKKLDLVIATHPHADHVAGLLAILDSFDVRRLWLCWHDEPNSFVQRLRAVAARRRTVVERPRQISFGSVTIDSLWPVGEPAHCAAPERSTNDNSIVVRLRWGKASALFAGDVEWDAERFMVSADRSLLSATVLKVPHHGSRTSSSPAFVRAISPKLAVISSARGNPFGFPSPAVIKRYTQIGAVVVAIQQHGAVVVRLNDEGALSWRAGLGRVP
jgi:competence protein ComEC